MNNYYITTPIYYVNDSPHIGHAYTSLACDVIARFKRLDGYNVMFLTGTDEHGQKIARSAEAKGMNPQEFVDQVSQKFRHLTEVMKFSNDDFIRTSEPRHKKVVQQIWQKLMDNGQIYLSKYAGWYAVRDEAFYNEDELIDGKAPTGAEVQWVEEESYFFSLSEWQEKLLLFYENNPDFIAPNSRRNEVISFVKSGLRDLSISRTTLFRWGIPVPDDEKHVIYVWLDALVNYISAVEWPKNPHNLWPADLHMVGKDILRFHAVYWPAFLMAADIPLPKRIFAHGWWTNEGQKISKSLGNVIDPLNLVSEFGLDYVRYFLMREIPFGNDGNYSRLSFIERINAELANNIGNLVQRVLSFVIKNCNGKVGAPEIFLESDQLLLEQAYNSIEKIRLEIERQSIHNALSIIIELSTKANEYITLNAPWELNKKDKARMHVVLYTLLEVIRIIGILLQPIMPDAAKKLLDQLNANERNFTAITKQSAPLCFEISAVNIIFPRLQQ